MIVFKVKCKQLLHEHNVFKKVNLQLSLNTDPTWLKCELHVGMLYTTVTFILINNHCRQMNAAFKNGTWNQRSDLMIQAMLAVDIQMDDCYEAEEEGYDQDETMVDEPF